jgi:RNA polymerase sigma factor (sigma-70 family)
MDSIEAADRTPDIDGFCRALHPRLVRALAGFLGDPRLAEELAQEAFARSLGRLGRPEVLDAEAYIFRTAFNLARSRLRRRSLASRSWRRLDRPVASWIDIDVAEAHAVRDALAQLPPRQRAAVVCRILADMSIEQTAQALDCAPGTVRALTHQGLTALRTLYSHDGGG